MLARLPALRSRASATAPLLVRSTARFSSSSRLGADDQQSASSSSEEPGPADADGKARSAADLDKLLDFDVPLESSAGPQQPPRAVEPDQQKPKYASAFEELRAASASRNQPATARIRASSGGRAGSAVATSTPGTLGAGGSFISPKRATGEHRLVVHSSRNNTILTLTRPEGSPLAWASGGSVGFKKAQRSGYEAAYRAALSLFERLEQDKYRWGVTGVEVVFVGFGQGREAVFRALQTAEGEKARALVRRLTDQTPIKIGGTRPPKLRML